MAPELRAWHGAYLIGGAANEAKADDSSPVIPWEIDSDQTEVAASCKPALEKPLGPEPLTVRDFMQYLESNGIVRTKFFQHTLSKAPDGNTYEIKPVDAHVFKPDPMDKFKKCLQRIAWQTLSRLTRSRSRLISRYCTVYPLRSSRT